MNERVLSSSHRLQQWTFDAIGHTLNHRQVFSPTGRFAYFDSRNRDAEIMSTDRIGRIDLQSGAVDWIYRVPHATPFGPGVGAVACHPERERLIFIHGLRNCDSDRPYSATRRFGAILDIRNPPAASVEHAEARCMAPAPPVGALRGGTHAHSWSADGRAISFTYNDAWIDQRHQDGIGPCDLRTVGMMWVDKPVVVPQQDDENFSGLGHAMLIASVNPSPTPGTDAIESAREECFLGPSNHALAFIGRVRTEQGTAIDEIFVARWPENPVASLGACEIGSHGRLEPPSFVQAERVTRSEKRPFPGISGPRSWLLASPDGNTIYCPMRDDAGTAQVAAVHVLSGRIEFLTDLASSLESPLALDPLGTRISLVSGGRVGILNLDSRDIQWSPDLRETLEIPWGAIHFLPEEKGYLFHAYPRNQTPKWQQLWTLTLH